MDRSKQWLIVAMVGCAVLAASGVVPAIVPALVPTANKIGNSAKFQLGTTGAVSGDCATFDASLNVTGPGTGAGCGGAGVAGGLVAGNIQVNASAGVDRYSNMAGAPSSTLTPTFAIGNLTPIAVAGTIKNLTVSSKAANTGTGAWTATIMINGTDTAVQVIVVGGAVAGIYSDLTHTVAVHVGDYVTMHASTADVVVSTSFGGFSFLIS